METALAPTPQNRRSQARASHACQMCRIKKAKCGQTMPCSNCESHGWTCVYEQRKRGIGSLRGRQRSQAEKPGVAINSGTPVPAVISPAASGISGAWNGPSDSSGFSPADSGERTPNKGNETPEWYQAHQGREKGQDLGIGTTSGENQQEIEPLRDVNEHTTGREYYGRSSKFALLGKLFAQARSNLSDGMNSEIPRQSCFFTAKPRTGGSMRPYGFDSHRHAVDGQISRPNQPTTDRLSIVNLLYDDGTSVVEPDSDPSVLSHSGRDRPASSASVHSRAHHRDSDPNEFAVMDETSSLGLASQQTPMIPSHPYRRGTFPTSQASDNIGRSHLEMVIEKEYLRLFFSNLYYIHPFLSQTQFTARCEKTIWSRWPLKEIPRRDQHFVALYNVILAVGSLTESPDTFLAYKEQLDRDHDASHSDMSTATSSIQLSRIFFDRSKRLLGDCFEVCSLESAQTLILMSLYWQNYLKPHACYMYSGMAVRTALAIGLPDSSMPQSVDWQNSARKTWWAIYSQEMDMCCSSGRMSSLMSPSSYDISFPQISGTTTSARTNAESQHVAIIPEMVKFAALLLRASKELYHEAKHLSMLQKSRIAFELDSCFTDWRKNLPSWLSPDSNALKEPEWVGKQKLVLEIRYQNAKILLHRPFVAASAVQQSREFGANVDACLMAARRTISLLYESYLHRHYFRSWRYNTTYTIYAATIILYLILLDYSAVSTDELLADVRKSLEILASMDEARVARRCFDLIQELLDFAQSHVQQHSRRVERQETRHAQYLNSLPPPAPGYDMGSSSVWSSQGFLSPAQSSINDTPSAVDRSMTEIWASMMDPIALEGFVASDEPIEGMMYDNSWFGGDIMQ